MNLAGTFLMLQPSITPPNNPYQTHEEILWIAPTWLALQLAFGLYGIRGTKRPYQLAALVAVVAPTMLIIAVSIASWAEILNYWRFHPLVR